MKFTALIQKTESGNYVGQIEEVPAALSQGRTIDELKANLSDALQLIFETNRESVRAEYEGKHLMEEVIAFPE